MIPVKADDDMMEAYVANIMTAYDRTTPVQRERGHHWYETANDLAWLLGGGDTRRGAGLIAALSANKRWGDNMRLAVDASQGNVHGHTRATLKKVAAILVGDDPESVLPMGLKTGNFFRCITDPGDPDPVVIDRHAHDIAVGTVYGNTDRGLSNKNRYAVLAHAYREAARRLDLVPSALQAVTWVAQVDALDGISTRMTKKKNQ